MRIFRMPLLLCFFVSASLAQLTMDQKIADFQHLAGQYAKNYAPYEWKRDTQGFDLLNIGPWLQRITATTNDLDFYEVMVDYVAHLNDAHDVYTVPSNFVATLNLSADIYDGKVLIDSINRTRLPASQYPFQIGDEVVSVDGQNVQDLIQAFSKYSISANTRSTQRTAVGRIFTRPQSRMPHAIDVGDSASVVIRRQNGDVETFSIPWVKSGLPLTTVGPVPNLTSDSPLASEETDPLQTDYMAVLHRLQNCTITERAVLNFGARSPIFAPPAGFTQRLGRSSSDFFYSGTFPAGGYNIGFIRIPSYAPPDENAAVLQFLQEILYFQANTDGLVIDEMRNPGGLVDFANILAQLLTPYQWRSIPFEIRATSNWVLAISSALQSARAQGADQWIIDTLQVLKNEITEANREFRGRTGPVPLDDVSIDRSPLEINGQTIAYTKPLMVLVDEFSASGGDYFPATIQDNGRGMIFGWRTMGAGGSVSDINLADYSEGATRNTDTLMNRKNPVVVPGYPAAPYVENLGVQPDMAVDYMTKDNLLQNGKPFVDAFVAAMVDYITKNK